MEPTLKTSVLEACRRADALAEVDELYRSVQAEIDRRRPVCVVSGRCCRFEEFGHRLYVTTLELARFVHDLGTSSAMVEEWDGTGCPFQRAKLCTVHAMRPFGCRMFFCDATSTAWQNDAYERFHAELKRMHERLGVPYIYIEWRKALELLGIAARP
jgi:Fe-S-cluster containining protein